MPNFQKKTLLLPVATCFTYTLHLNQHWKPLFVSKVIYFITLIIISLEVHVQKKYFKAWRLGAGMDKKEPTETDPIVSKEGKEDKQV